MNTLPTRQSEKALQESIIELLTLEGATVLQYAKVGARSKCPKCGAWVGQVITQEKGHPDILAIWDEDNNNNHIWFEVKRLGEKATPDQLKMHAKLERVGDAMYLVESLEDVQEALLFEGFTLRTEEVNP